MTLQQHLSHCYMERHGVGFASGAFLRLRDALRADPSMERDARAQVASYDDGVLKRDHISRQQKQILEEVLLVRDRDRDASAA